MERLLQIFIWLPIVGFVVSVLLPLKKEFAISSVSIATSGMLLLGALTFFVYWLLNDSPTLDIKHITLFKTANIEIFIDFFFDKITAAFSIVGAILIFAVVVFSRFYLHREEGFKRFFVTLLCFYLGYNLIIF